MFTLNVMCSFLAGYYNRNDWVRKFLDERAEFFPEKEEVYVVLNETAEYISEMQLAENSIWWNKANFFTLFVELSRLPILANQPAGQAGEKLKEFERNVDPRFALAAREAVNGRHQRELRADYLRRALGWADGVDQPKV